MPRLSGESAGSIYQFLNVGALGGWSAVLLILVLSQCTTSLSAWTDRCFQAVDDGNIPLIKLMFRLEWICFIEVGRIAIGQLKGNLVLGVVLHLIRMTCLLLVLPAGLANGVYEVNNSNIVSILVLYSWSLTDVGRYPMYLFPNSSKARYIRLVLPIFTFPLGAAAEAIGAYRVLLELLNSGDGGTSSIVYLIKVGSLGMVVLINCLLGPTMAYPALLKKGVPVLMGKGEKKRTKTS